VSTLKKTAPGFAPPNEMRHAEAQEQQTATLQRFLRKRLKSPGCAPVLRVGAVRKMG
jgi:hypothetical protein